MQIPHSRTDLDPRKFDVKQIFPDTARQPQPPHIKEQTDGRISQTIVGIQSNQAKREFFPGFSVRHLARFDAPAEKSIAWTGKQNRLYKPHAATEGAWARSERPPAGSKFELALRRNHFQPTCCHSNFREPCNFCAHEPTLTHANSTSNKLSQTPRANHDH